MQTTCGAILGLVSLVLTNLGIIIGFASPYWLEYRFILKFNRGLWASCDNSDCTWVFDNDFRLQKSLPDWFQATQVLMSVGLAASLVALLIATLSLCCSCKGCNPNNPVSGLLIIAFLTMGVAVAIFGIKASDEWSIEMNWEQHAGGRFGWSFWVAIGASVMALLTSIIYGCISRKYPS